MKPKHTGTRTPHALIALIALLTFANLAWGLSAQEIAEADTRPGGVVFEIIEGNGSDLDWAFRQIQEDIQTLHARFPGLPIAVVSHGSEQFALANDKAQQFGEIHELGRSLTDAGVDLHVCATHASWRGIGSDAFADFVQVSDTGPGEVQRYREKGYKLIMVERR